MTTITPVYDDFLNQQFSNLSPLDQETITNLFIRIGNSQWAIDTYGATVDGSLRVNWVNLYDPSTHEGLGLLSPTEADMMLAREPYIFNQVFEVDDQGLFTRVQ